MSLQVLIDTMNAFYAERDWHKFHSPKNLCMDIGSEVGELMDHFRWLTEEESAHLSEAQLAEVKDEIGDVFMVLAYLAHRLGIDPVQASFDKLEKIGRKYPVSTCKGSGLKYTHYEQEAPC